jgi:hypothetical protein
VRQIQAALKPVRSGTDGFVSASQAESDDQYRNRLVAVLRQNDPDSLLAAELARKRDYSSELLDGIGSGLGIARRGSDLLTNAPLNVSPASDKLKRVDAVDGMWNVYHEMIRQQQAEFSRMFIGVDPASDSKPSLSWLSRLLSLAPDAPEDVIRATVTKRLAGDNPQLTMLAESNRRLQADLNFSRRTVESLLDDVARTDRENDDLRAMVADRDLEIRRLRKGGK